MKIGDTRYAIDKMQVITGTVEEVSGVGLGVNWGQGINFNFGFEFRTQAEDELVILQNMAIDRQIKKEAKSKKRKKRSFKLHITEAMAMADACPDTEFNFEDIDFE